MIAAGRTEEQQDAVYLVNACPHPIVASNDLMHVLVPREDDERVSDWKKRMLSVAAVLREIGAQTARKKVKVEYKSTRVWILREPTKWAGATAAALTAAALQAHKDFQQYYDADALIAFWRRGERELKGTDTAV